MNDDFANKQYNYGISIEINGKMYSDIIRKDAALSHNHLDINDILKNVDLFKQETNCYLQKILDKNLDLTIGKQIEKEKEKEAQEENGDDEVGE